MPDSAALEAMPDFCHGTFTLWRGCERVFIKPADGIVREVVLDPTLPSERIGWWWPPNVLGMRRIDA